MAHAAKILDRRQALPDYSLAGVNSKLAIEKGLAEAEWYQCPVPRDTMRVGFHSTVVRGHPNLGEGPMIIDLMSEPEL